MSVHPKKSLGQNFLISPGIAEKIVRLAGVNKDSHVLEVGPGKGCLTKFLIKASTDVVAVEKDPRLYELLKGTVPAFSGDCPRGMLICDDILDFDFTLAFSEGDRDKNIVVANLPYNIATEVIFKCLDHRDRFSKLVLMVQKEVALRLTASPGGKDYGIPSILTQLFSVSRILFSVPPTAFFPKPKVTSAIIEMKLSSSPRFPVDDIEMFKKIVRAAFGQRRKTILNALKGKSTRNSFERVPGTFSVDCDIVAALKNAGIDPSARAETIPIEKFAALSKNGANGK